MKNYLGVGVVSIEEQLSRAIKIASEAHFGQFDKGGKPYILHPLRLMNELLYDYQLATIAVLHDVIEDTDWALRDLAQHGFSDRVMNALELLTHRKGVPYEEYITGIMVNIDAVIIKRKDLKDNSDITRLKGITEKDFKRMEKYHKAYVRLTEMKRLYKN